MRERCAERGDERVQRHNGERASHANGGFLQVRVPCVRARMSVLAETYPKPLHSVKSLTRPVLVPHYHPLLLLLLPPQVVEQERPAVLREVALRSLTIVLLSRVGVAN